MPVAEVPTRSTLNRAQPCSLTLSELRALGSSLFAELRDEDLQALSQSMLQRDYRAGQIVLVEGSASTVLYVVQHGRLKLFKTSSKGREQVIRLLRPGDTFNEISVFDEGPNSASARVLEDCRLYLVRRTDIVKLMTERPGVALALTKTFAKRLRQALELVEDLSFRDVASRVAKILLQGEEDGSEAPITHELLAAMAGTRREVVGRALKALNQEGVIRLARGRIHVVDARALERLVWA